MLLSMKGGRRISQQTKNCILVSLKTYYLEYKYTKSQ